MARATQQEGTTCKPKPRGGAKAQAGIKKKEVVSKLNRKRKEKQNYVAIASHFAFLNRRVRWARSVKKKGGYLTGKCERGSCLPVE
jgi:hypothetical protein